MEKSLSERIADRVLKQKSSAGDQNRAVFLALRDEIQKAINDGWTVMVIWKTLRTEGKVDFSYQAFRTYVKSLTTPRPPDSNPNPESVQGSVPPPPAPPLSRRAFVFDPVPDKRKLLGD
jgi:hypothetical protein